jgi:[protein-PII] uridylyltransferase
MDGMSSGLTSLRETYEKKRQEIREAFFLTRDPTEALQAMSDAVDALVQGVYAGVPPELFSVVALGGYGRREQYPFSDVDLLFVYKDHEKEAAQKHITVVLHALWDSKLQLGHQVWNLESLKALSADDFEFMLALLDAKVVCAAGDQYDTVHATITGALEQQRLWLVDRLVESTEARHAGFRSTIYQLEPDLKQAPGGLRDYQAAKWLLRLSGQTVQYSETDVENAHNAIGRLRILLHFEKGRAQNQLTHRAQEEIARLNGYGEDSLQSGVESLMMEYFLNAKILHSVCTRTVRTVSRRDPQIYLDCPVPPRTANEVLDLFLHAIVSRKGLSDEARSCVADALPSVSRTIFLPDVRYRLRDLLKPRAGLYRTLSEMYELGFLEMLFPEFDSIKARMIRDFYHKYTVDEHTLQAIKNIEDLLSTDQPSDLRFRSLLLDSPDAELLTLALLLHDIGKRGKARTSTAVQAWPQKRCAGFTSAARTSKLCSF